MKRPYLWITFLSGITFYACSADETDEAGLVGTWHLTEHYYSSPGNTYTLTYGAGEIEYRFYDDHYLLIVAAGQENQTRCWEMVGNMDSLKFDVGVPWEITENSDGAFKAKLHPYTDAQATYAFTKVE